MSIRTTKIASILLSVLLGLAATTASAQTSMPSPTPVAEFEEFTDLDQEVAPGWTVRDLLEAEPIDEVIDLDEKGSAAEPEPAMTPEPSIYIDPVFKQVPWDLVVEDRVMPATTGRVFSRRPGTDNPVSCTGSVVSSNNGGIVLTAAHCLYAKNDPNKEPKFETEGPNHSVFFMPGYYEYTRHGTPWPDSRFGVWHEVSRSVDPDWLDSRRAGDDQAFMTVRMNMSETNLRDVVGSNGIFLNAPTTMEDAVIWGYHKIPAEEGSSTEVDTPTHCAGKVTPTKDNNLVAMVCPDAIPGWSGGPWFYGDHNTNQGWVFASTSTELTRDRMGGARIDNSTIELYENEVAKGN